MGLFSKVQQLKKDFFEKLKERTSAKKSPDEGRKEKAVKKEEEKKEKTPHRKKTVRPELTNILLRPIISEKATFGVGLRQYLFEVERGANKIMIRKAFEQIYGIRPVAVQVKRRHGKSVRYGKYRGARRETKYAVITLPEGEKIQIYEGV